MEKITLRQLHSRTGHWVRRASTQGPIKITDRGREIAVLVEPSVFFTAAKDFPKRNRSSLPLATLDSTTLVTEDRDR